MADDNTHDIVVNKEPLVTVLLLIFKSGDAVYSILTIKYIRIKAIGHLINLNIDNIDSLIPNTAISSVAKESPNTKNTKLIIIKIIIKVVKINAFLIIIYHIRCYYKGICTN